MKKETFLHRIITKLFKWLGVIEEQKVNKEEMCRKAVVNGVCPRCCEICAWYSEEE